MKKTFITFIVIFLLMFFVQWLQTWRLNQRQGQMNEMLMEHGVMDSEGELLPPYSGE